MATTPYPFVSGTVLTASQLNSTFNIPTTTKTASHTLVAADAGTRVIMNSASATTITVNTSIFAASDVVEIQNIGAGVCTITAGTATVSTTGSLALAQNGSGRLVFTAAGTSIFQANAVAAPGIAIFNETQANGTNGGSSVATTWSKRTLNTTIVNNIGATLTSSVIALLAGSYEVEAFSPFLLTNSVKIKLRNTTDSTDTIIGQNNYFDANNSVAGAALLQGYFVITATKNFELQYWVKDSAVTNGLGTSTTGGTGVSEIYSSIKITKVA